VIVKVRLSNFTRVGALSLAGAEYLPYAPIIDSTGGFAYIGANNNAGQGVVAKVRLSDFTSVRVLNTTLGGMLSSVIDTGSGFAYFGGDPMSGSGPGVIVKVRLSDLTEVGAMTLNAGEGWPTSSVIDSVAGFAYFGVSNFCTVGAILKVRLSDFTRVAYLSLNPYECTLYNAVLDPVHGFAYFAGGGCNIPPPWDPRPTCASPAVVKVRLSNFTRVGSLDLGGERPSSSIIDSASGFAYFGLHSDPGVVVKVRLSNFTRAGSITLNSGEDELLSAVFDPSSGFAYFGTSGFPTEVVKVEVASPIIPFHAPSLLDQFVWWAPYFAVALGIVIVTAAILTVTMKHRPSRVSLGGPG
jgi:hypothetical protein